MNYVKKSKYLSYILRHHPEKFNLEIDSDGFVDVEKLIKNTDFENIEELKDLVEHETRYTFNEDFSKIKAFHGHSVKGITYENIVENPPEKLYHGTSTENYQKIINSGMIKGMSRVQVHLSETISEAKKIGQRHGKPIVLEINVREMLKDGYKFSKSEDGVFLVKDFPVKYTKILEE